MTLVEGCADENYNTIHPREEKIDVIKSKLEEVRVTLKDNIVKVIERGENIDATLEKTEALNDHATLFLNDARNLKRRMYLRKLKIKALIFFLVLLILTGFICWIYFASK